MIVLQYGSITYPTDSITHINLDIMRWVTVGDMSPSIKYYDYYICLSSSVYPLWGAREMAKFLKQDERRIRIGHMGYYKNPQELCYRHSTYFGLVATNGSKKKEKRRMLDWAEPGILGSFVNELRSTVLPSLPTEENFYVKHVQACTLKTNSGNTAAYDRESVIDLLSSPEAIEFLTRFKLSGGCCHEESSWAGAWGIISNTSTTVTSKNTAKTDHRRDYVAMMKKPGAVWQAWPCREVIQHNFVFLDRNFPTEKETHSSSSLQSPMVNGNYTESHPAHQSPIQRKRKNRTGKQLSNNLVIDEDKNTCIQIFDGSWADEQSRPVRHDRNG